MGDFEEEWQEDAPVGVMPPPETTRPRGYRSNNDSYSEGFSGRGSRGRDNNRRDTWTRGPGGRGASRSDDSSNWRDRGSRGSTNSRENRFQDGGNRKIITVPSNKVGRIIGKGGSKIRDLEFESEAKIKIGDSSGNTTDITLTGTDEAIARVEEMVMALTEEYVRPSRDAQYGPT